MLSKSATSLKNNRKLETADFEGEIELSSEGGSAREDNKLGPHGSADESEEDEEEAEGVGKQRRARAANGNIKGVKGRNERVMSPVEVRNHLRLVFKNEPDLCTLLFGRHNGSPRSNASDPISQLADMFFMDVIPVTPTRFRPASKLGDDLFENSQNTLLSAVLTTCEHIQELNQRLINQAKAERAEIVLDAVDKAEGSRSFSMLLEALMKLQHDVNSFMDSSKNPSVIRQGKLPPQGVKQLLEKKEGLFRKHMMVCLRESILV